MTQEVLRYIALALLMALLYAGGGLAARHVWDLSRRPKERR